MKVLLTGASGFLGRHLAQQLKTKFQVIRLSRSAESDILCDLSISVPKLEKYEMVVHAAGKAHSVPKTEEEKNEFYKVNSLGTENLLKSLESALPKVFVLISTVAVYGIEKGENIEEDELLKGGSAYADSKIEAEKMVDDWCEENNVIGVILRLPLVAGSNPPGNLEAMAKAIKKGFYFRIGKASAKRSMVSANDIGKLITHGKLKEGIYNLTDGIHPSIAETEEHLAKLFGKSIKSLPIKLIQSVAKIGDVVAKFPLNTNRLNKLTQTLTFSDKKARVELRWEPMSALTELTID